MCWNHGRLYCICVQCADWSLVGGAQEDFFAVLFVFERGLQVLAGHEAPVSRVMFSPSDPIVASCSWDGTVRLSHLFGRGRGAGSREMVKTKSHFRSVVPSKRKRCSSDMEKLGVMWFALHFAKTAKRWSWAFSMDPCTSGRWQRLSISAQSMAGDGPPR